jgi:hypothetical protein
VVRGNQKSRRVGEHFVLLQDSCVHVAVRRDQWELSYLVVQFRGKLADRGVGVQQAFGMGKVLSRMFNHVVRT